MLPWLLGESPGTAILSVLQNAEFVVTSDLTLIECDRAFYRACFLGEFSKDRFEELRGLRRVAAGWVRLRITDDIVERARGPFPEEPIRSPDALHLASVLEVLALIPQIAILTLDGRVRRCGRAMGLQVFPGSDPAAGSQ